MNPEHATKELQADGNSLIDSLFLALSEERKIGGDRFVSDQMQRWSHRLPINRDHDWRHLGLNRECLQSAAEQYLRMPWLHCAAIDWLLADVLTFAECISTHDALLANMLPMSQYVALKSGKLSGIISATIWRWIKRLLEVTFWVVLFAVSFGAAPVGPILVGAWFVYSLYRRWEKHKVRAKAFALLQEMFGTYENLRAINISWRVFWDDLARSRRSGAVWDGVLYRLVELRLEGVSPGSAAS